MGESVSERDEAWAEQAQDELSRAADSLWRAMQAMKNRRRRPTGRHSVMPTTREQAVEWDLKYCERLLATFRERWERLR